MYSQHFGLTQDPFSIAPDPRYLFMSERHREALAHLLYGVSGSPDNTGGRAGGTGGGFVLLTGDIGAGKTTICRCFLEQIPPHCRVAYIFNPRLSALEMLQSICEEFHIDLGAPAFVPRSVKDYIDALNVFLLQGHAAGCTSVLIIDEAQNLAPEVLEQLRLLTNLETSERKLLQIVLIGQPELRAMLARPELEQLAQRVIARFHLGTLSASESAQYIQHRLAVAGHNGPSPFDRRALQRIHRITHGVPRRINLLCGRALLGAWAHGLHRVDRAVVNKAAAEVFGQAIQHGGVPNSRPAALTTLAMPVAIFATAALAVTATAIWLEWPASPENTRSKPPQASTPPRTLVPTSVPTLTLTPTPTPTPTPSPVFTSAPATAPVAVVTQELEALLPLMPSDIRDAWRELALLWKLPAQSSDPCQADAALELQCYRTGKLTLPQLRQLKRPGILTLQPPNGAAVHAVLTGLTEQKASFQVNSRPYTVKLISLGRLWRGEYATYWRAPPGYNLSSMGVFPDGAAGPMVEELARKLSLIDGEPLPPSSKPPILDAALRERVRAFQRAQGLSSDGQPGPMTLMQIDSLTSVNEPRLKPELR